LLDFLIYLATAISLHTGTPMS